MPLKHKRYFLRAKESKVLLGQASKRLKVDLAQILGHKVNLEIVETADVEIFVVDMKPILVKTAENIFPTLVFKEFFELAPKVIVDMGAVVYVCKGANVMAPGIRGFEGDFGKGDLVLVVDEKHGRPIAVGEIIYDAQEVGNVKQGVVVKSLHFVGDGIWDLVKEIAASAKVKDQSGFGIRKSL
jgi:PUA-domain protein